MFKLKVIVFDLKIFFFWIKHGLKTCKGKFAKMNIPIKTYPDVRRDVALIKTPSVALLVVYLKRNYFNSIVKQVLTTYLNHYLVRFLEPTSICDTLWIMVASRVEFEPTIPKLRRHHIISGHTLIPFLPWHKWCYLIAVSICQQVIYPRIKRNYCQKIGFF